MRRTLALLLMLASSACSSVPDETAAWEQVRGATHTLRVGDNGKCSATAVSPNALLTAEHCIKGPLFIDGKPLLTTVLLDGNDHALVLVEGRPFKTFVKVGTHPSPGTMGFIWGNPDGFTNMFRRGELMGFDGHIYVWDMNTWFGDSGAGIFSPQGELVGVVVTMRLPFHITGDLPLKFTKAQWAKATR